MVPYTFFFLQEKIYNTIKLTNVVPSPESIDTDT